MRKLLLSIAALLCAVTTNLFATEGALNGKFTVNADGKKVQFSQGNLQYNAGDGETHATATGIAQGTWRFAARQYDIIGADNNNIAEDYNGYIDLFGWGTSGYNGVNPWLNSTNDLDYGNPDPDNTRKSDIAGTNYDWGVFNAIYNGGDEPGLWRTLTAAEWEYIVAGRENAAKLISKASIGSTTGILLLPDDWDFEALPLTATLSDYTTVTIDVLSWTKWEDAGAVFLPSAGLRNPNSGGYSSGGITYASSSFDSLYGTYRMNKTFDASYTSANMIGVTDYQIGLSVRLVKDAPTYQVTIQSAEGKGSVSVAESTIDLTAIEEGTKLHLTAVPAVADDENPDCNTWTSTFDHWEISYWNGSFWAAADITGATAAELELEVNVSYNVKAVFKTTWKLDINVNGHGRIAVTNRETGVELTAEELLNVPDNTSLTLTAIPDEGFSFLTWTGSYKDFENQTTLTITASDTYACYLHFDALFGKETCKVTLVETEKGTIQCTTEGIDLNAVPGGTTLTFVATPSEGFTSDWMEWFINDDNLGDDSNPLSITITEDTEIEVDFLLEWQKITIESSTGGQVVCTTTGVNLEHLDYDMSEPYEITFLAANDDHYTIKEWYVNDVPQGNNTANFTYNQEYFSWLHNVSIRCEFKPVNYTVTLAAAALPEAGGAPARRMPQETMVFSGGTIGVYCMRNFTSPNSFDVPYGTEIERIWATANEGWVFDHYNINGVMDKKEDEITTITVTQDITITGYFREAEKYKLTLQDDGNGVVCIPQFSEGPGTEIYSTEPIEVFEGQELVLIAHPNSGYELDHWDNYTTPYYDEEEYDWIYPQMPAKDLIVKAHFRLKEDKETTEGALAGYFTIQGDLEGEHYPHKAVQFSQGNLQYIAGDGKTHKVADETLSETNSARRGTWQFAAEQTEYIGSKNINAAEDYESPIDVFCYGASGYNNRYPWLSTTSVLRQNIDSTNYDFGVFNAISNGGNEPGLWRTLTYTEWYYMLYVRCYETNPVYYGRYLHGIGTADGEPGLFLMPDGWVMPGELVKAGVQFLPLAVANFTTNKYTAAQWAILEQSGVVFIPAGGARYDMGSGTTMYAVGQAVYSQSSTYGEGGMAYAMGAMATVPGEFDGGTIVDVFPAGDGGCSVRLVRDVPESEIEEGIENVRRDDVQCTKELRNGQLFIIRQDGAVFNALGERVK